MSLLRELAEWDGKSAGELRATYGRHSASASFLEDLLDALDEASLQRSATWLMKHFLDEGGSWSASVSERLFSAVDDLEHWESKLHALQILDRCGSMPETCKEQIVAFLRVCVADEAKFVRAWAYSGYHRLARQFPEYEAEAKRLISRAYAEEAPSVRARIRRVLET